MAVKPSRRLIHFAVACSLSCSVFVTVGSGHVNAVGGAGLVPLAPARLMDTRADSLTVDGSAAGLGRLAAGSTWRLTVGGRGGVPGDAGAVMLNVTVVAPDAAGFATVFPCGSQTPLASNLNFAPGDVIANAVFAKIGADRQVCFFMSVSTDLIVDVNGFSTVGGPTPIVPARFLDTRSKGATIDGITARSGRLAAGSTLSLPVAGRSEVPVYAISVFVNITAVLPDGPGYLTVFPCGKERPNASNLNVLGGEVVPNAAVVKTGQFGAVCIYTSVAMDVVVDVNGYTIPGGPPSVAPARLLDTREGSATVDGRAAGVGRVAGGSTLSLVVAGRSQVPLNAEAVLLNVTAVAPDGPGYVTVFPCGIERPLASNLNFSQGDVVPGAVLAKVGSEGKVCFFVSTGVDMVVDVNGFSTIYNPARWSNPSDGLWEYDGDGDGVVEEAWLDSDADASYDAYGFDIDDDGSSDWFAFDVSNSASIDAWWDIERNEGQLLYFDLNEDWRYEIALYDVDRDGYAEVVLGDVDGNGLFEAALGDPGADGTFEQYMRDTDGDGLVDTWFTFAEQAPPPPPQEPTLDDVYRQMAGETTNYAPIYLGGASNFTNFLTANHRGQIGG